jgi:hypothetical protein
MWLEQFEHLRLVELEYFDQGEWILIPCRLRGRGRGSEIEVDEPYVFADHSSPRGQWLRNCEKMAVDPGAAAA